MGCTAYGLLGIVLFWIVHNLTSEALIDIYPIPGLPLIITLHSHPEICHTGLKSGMFGLPLTHRPNAISRDYRHLGKHYSPPGCNQSDIMPGYKFYADRVRYYDGMTSMTSLHSQAPHPGSLRIRRFSVFALFLTPLHQEWISTPDYPLILLVSVFFSFSNFSPNIALNYRRLDEYQLNIYSSSELRIEYISQLPQRIRNNTKPPKWVPKLFQSLAPNPANPSSPSNTPPQSSSCPLPTPSPGTLPLPSSPSLVPPFFSPTNTPPGRCLPPHSPLST